MLSLDSQFFKMTRLRSVTKNQFYNLFYFFTEKEGDQDHIATIETQRMIDTLRKTIDTRKMIKIGIKMIKTDIQIETGTTRKKKRGTNMTGTKNIEMTNIPEMKNIKNLSTEMKTK